MGITRVPADRRLDCATCRDLKRHRHTWLELYSTPEQLRYGCVACGAKKTVKHPRLLKQPPPPIASLGPKLGGGPYGFPADPFEYYGSMEDALIRGLELAAQNRQLATLAARPRGRQN